MPKALDLTGKRFGNLIALNKESSQGGHTYWKFKCDCGQEKIIQTGHVVNGSIQSCGCKKEKFNQTKIKQCEICGKDFIIEGFGQATRKYCLECSPATNNPTQRLKAMKKKVVELKGGKCIRCGYDKCIDALEFHHVDPSTKDFKMANTGAAPSFEKYLEEANKCILLCANCHREEHWRLRQKDDE